MAGAGERAWTNTEKNYLLAEIIKAYSPHPNVLLNFVQHLPGQVDWNDIPLPPGRSLRSCQNAYNELASAVQTPFQPNIIGPQTSSPLTIGQPLKRSHASIEGAQAGGREIRPKLPTGTVSYGPVTAVEQPPRKRRGRPSKASIQARADSVAESSRPRLVPKAPRPPDPPLFAASPDPVTSPLTTRSQSAASESRFPTASEAAAGPSSAVAPVPRQTQAMRPPIEESQSIPPPISRLPISAMLTPTERPSISPSNSSAEMRQGQQGSSSRGEIETRPSASTPVLPSTQAQGIELRDARMGGVSDDSAESPEAPTAMATSAKRGGAEEASQQQQWPQQQQPGGEERVQASRPYYRPPTSNQ